MILCFLLVASLCQPVPRSQAVLREFQKLYPCPSTGLTYGKCPGYIKDHDEPLCKCGKACDAVWNIRWQTVAAAKEKDKREKEECRKLGCHHRGD
jgi:hypothetical protein